MSKGVIALQLSVLSWLAADGDFVVVWSSQVEFSSFVVGRRFSSAGIAQNVQFAVTTFSTINSFQDHARVQVDADGDFVVVWESGGQDGAQYGVTGAVGDGCTRCDAPSITAYLQTFL